MFSHGSTNPSLWSAGARCALAHTALMYCQWLLIDWELFFHSIQTKPQHRDKKMQPKTFQSINIHKICKMMHFKDKGQKRHRVALIKQRLRGRVFTLMFGCSAAFHTYKCIWWQQHNRMCYKVIEKHFLWWLQSRQWNKSFHEAFQKAPMHLHACYFKRFQIFLALSLVFITIQWTLLQQHTVDEILSIFLLS